MAKKFGIQKSRNNDTIYIVGTLEELVYYFEHVIRYGNLMNHRISLNPKTIKTFIRAVNNSYFEDGSDKSIYQIDIKDIPKGEAHGC